VQCAGTWVISTEIIFMKACTWCACFIVCIFALFYIYVCLSSFHTSSSGMGFIQLCCICSCTLILISSGNYQRNTEEAEIGMLTWFPSFLWQMVCWHCFDKLTIIVTHFKDSTGIFFSMVVLLCKMVIVLYFTNVKRIINWISVDWLLESILCNAVVTNQSSKSTPIIAVGLYLLDCWDQHPCIASRCSIRR